MFMLIHKVLSYLFETRIGFNQLACIDRKLAEKEIRIKRVKSPEG